MKNSDFVWDQFDSQAYFSTNYTQLRHDDLEIIGLIRDFLIAEDLPENSSGVDVGSGTNLYPALAMVPWCSKITLWEYSSSNVKWLRHQVKSYDESWDDFWETLTKTNDMYPKIHDPRRELAKRAEVHRGSIFELPAEEWDIGTMFFVAESLTEQMDEFRLAVRCFLRSLKPNGVFVAAFMEQSVGYEVGSHTFPAVSISRNDVEDTLSGLVDGSEIHRVEAGTKALRPGYSGMLLAMGRRSSDNLGGEA